MGHVNGTDGLLEKAVGERSDDIFTVIDYT